MQNDSFARDTNQGLSITGKSKSAVGVSAKSVGMSKIEENINDKLLREARERYLKIKAETDAPRDNLGGVKIFNTTGVSYNKFATK